MKRSFVVAVIVWKLPLFPRFTFLAYYLMVLSLNRHFDVVYRNRYQLYNLLLKKTVPRSGIKCVWSRNWDFLNIIALWQIFDTWLTVQTRSKIRLFLWTTCIRMQLLKGYFFHFNKSQLGLVLQSGIFIGKWLISAKRLHFKDW